MNLKQIELLFLAIFALAYQIIELLFTTLPYCLFVMLTIQEVYEPMREQIYILNKPAFFNLASEAGLFLGFTIIFLMVLSLVIFLAWQAHKYVGGIVLRRVDKISQEIYAN